jgi:Protein of unknown function (DUF4233)
MKQLRQLCATVLITEAIVIALAIPVAIAIEHVNGSLAGAIGGALAVVAVLLTAVIGKPGMRWAIYAGTVLQILVIASGIAVPAMYFLGAIFGALWATGIRLAHRIAQTTR